MEITPDQLSMVVCPECQGKLHVTKEEVLLCVRCRLCFPFIDGMPDLNPANALPVGADGKPVVKSKTAFFTITEGKDGGVNFRVDAGCCKAIGRRIDDAANTQVFNLDFTMTLDEHTQKLILNYLAKTTGSKIKNKKGVDTHDLGNFKRLSDLILNDPGASRLHAMIFYDENGVGILDLVSKNGTFVNGKEIEAMMVKPGDEIRVGATRMTFVLK